MAGIPHGLQCSLEDAVMTDETDFKKVLTQFTREMMGPSVAHMSDDELDAWMEPYRRQAEAVKEAGAPIYPAWFVKHRNEVRSKLLAVLVARTAQ